MGISVNVIPGLTAEETQIENNGEQDLGFDINSGAIIAGLDAYLSANPILDVPGKLTWHLDNGVWPRAKARVLHTVPVFDLHPEALQSHIWDNSEGVAPTKFRASLHREITVERTVSWDTKLTVGDSFTTHIEVSGGPIKAGASNTISVQAEVGKSQSNSESLSVGTDDEVEATLDPGKAELVVLTVLGGSLVLVTTLQTYWDGAIWWQKAPHGTWHHNTIDEIGHIIKPWDDGYHNGIITQNTKIGAVSSVDQKIEKLVDTSSHSISDAINKALSSTHV